MLSSYLTVDGNGDLAIPSGALGQDRLGFDPATQNELDSHAGDTANPHNVTDDQTGAATALSNHAGDANAHHSKPSTASKVESGSFSPAADGVYCLYNGNIRWVYDDGSSDTFAVSTTLNASHILSGYYDGSTFYYEIWEMQ